jgi:hypothetical protein
MLEDTKRGVVDVREDEALHESLSRMSVELEMAFYDFSKNLSDFLNKKKLVSLKRARRVSRTLEAKLKEFRRMLRGLL